MPCGIVVHRGLVHSLCSPCIGISLIIGVYEMGGVSKIGYCVQDVIIHPLVAGVNAQEDISDPVRVWLGLVMALSKRGVFVAIKKKIRQAIAISIKMRILRQRFFMYSIYSDKY